MLVLLLLSLLSPAGCSRTVDQDLVFKERHSHEEVASTTRPHIYYCRSPNMEDFTCWWHPLVNLTDGEPVTYALSYSQNKGPKQNCPDYVSAGPNSCHFDSSHTSIWKIYCMNVTAITAHRNYTSQEYCLDVADIVQTEAPVNLSYVLKDAGGDEMGHNVLLSWTYPLPSDLQYGWITLVYELQYRRVTEPHNWKVKQPLKEPHVELLGLPVGDFVVRVRCRSHNYGLWSQWSATLSMSIPGRPPTGKLLVRILVSGVGVVALLVIAFGVLPQSKRIKDYFLPPIPKPRILGIDPLLLKKGNLDEINRHLTNFHSYSPPSYTEEFWECVTADDTPKVVCGGVAPPEEHQERGSFTVPCGLAPSDALHGLAAQYPTWCAQSVSPYCSSPSEAFAPPPSSAPWPRLEVMVSPPGAEYSILGQPAPHEAPAPSAVPVPAGLSPQDFYTCVQLMDETGEVHLVPSLPPPPAYCREFPPLSKVGLDAEEEKKKKKKAEYLASMNAMNRPRDSDEVEGGTGDAAELLLLLGVDNRA